MYESAAGVKLNSKPDCRRRRQHSTVIVASTKAGENGDDPEVFSLAGWVSFPGVWRWVEPEKLVVHSLVLSASS
jgi:hypothetical protein